MADAEAEYEALKALTGWAVWLPLKSIDWDVDYVFCNGTRSPPWRQEFGELGYLEIRLQDREKLVATVAKNGYFLNKGYTKNEKGELKRTPDNINSITSPYFYRS
jgi:hypothetical protein